MLIYTYPRAALIFTSLEHTKNIVSWFSLQGYKEAYSETPAFT